MTKKILYIFGIILIVIIGFRYFLSVNNKANIESKNSQNIEVVQQNTENKTLKPKPEKPPIKKPVVKKVVPCPKPQKQYEDNLLLPISQKVGLPDTSYTPLSLEKVKTELSTKEGICLIKEAKDNFQKMVEKAKKDGYSIKVSSGFRDYTYQKNLLSDAIKNGNANADIAIAKAGYSEHQLGTAVDVTGQSIDYDSASNKFNKTEEAKWMEENASDYGFVMSYPIGKEDTTGYMYEPWHYRYVGIDIANEIIKSGLTTVEYLENKQKELPQNATAL